MKIGLIGAGAMGSAIVKAFEKEQLFVCDRHPKKIEALGIKNGFKDPSELISQVDVVIFAVKPQSFTDLVKSLKIDMASKMIVSVMTGITIAQLKAATGSKAIIRCMPNLAVQVEKGVTAWIAADGVTDDFRHFIQKSFDRLGVAIELRHEKQIDVVTAISGSGPAYFFALAEALIAAAEELGIPAEQARLLAENTLVGSGQLMALENRSAGEWKCEIMVPGGTTEAGIRELKKRGFEQSVIGAAKAAHRRAKELYEHSGTAKSSKACE